jgi:hypothetical protein
MNLEAVEQTCLAYLKQTEKPMVPVERLMRHLNQREDCAGISEFDLLGFLRRHELFKVIDTSGLPLGIDDAAALAEAGIETGPQVMLVARIPSPAQLAEQMADQLEKLTEALSRALGEAKATGQSDKARELIKMLSRAEEIQKELKNLTLE